ncbi:MAG: thioredoxin domain-containing protein [Alphaproteobacteria bacterium]
MKQHLPLIWLAGIGLLLLAGLQLARVFLSGGVTLRVHPQAMQTAAVDAQSSGNVFQDMVLKHPKAKRNLEKIPTSPVRASVPIEPFNAAQGAEYARLTLTVFDDPSCGVCRAEVQRVLRGVPPDVRIVFKFAPVDERNTSGGLFRQLAVQQRIWPQVAQLLEGNTADLDAEAWSRMMEELGVSLDDLRALLAKDSESLMQDVEADAALARSIPLPAIPAFVLNDYVIDGALLKTEKLPVYIQRLSSDSPIVERSDFAAPLQLY